MGTQPIDIEKLATSLAAAHPALEAGAVARYVGEIVRWNPRIGVVSKQDTGQVLERLVKQSLCLHEMVAGHPGASSVVDVGTGGGFPGIVWALVEPGWRFLLVERRHKKTVFLERVIRVLDLHGVEVYTGDAVEAQAIERFAARFDVATAMAVGPPVRTAPLVEGFLREGGLFATTVARDEPEPRARVGARLELAAARSDEDSVYALYAMQ